MSWIVQINEMGSKSECRMHLIKQIGGKTWDATQDVISLVYKYVRSAMESGAEAVNTPDTMIYKLEIEQNKALILILGMPGSIEIAVMQIQSNFESMTTQVMLFSKRGS